MWTDHAELSELGVARFALCLMHAGVQPSRRTGPRCSARRLRRISRLVSRFGPTGAEHLVHEPLLRPLERLGRGGEVELGVPGGQGGGHGLRRRVGTIASLEADRRVTADRL